MPAAGSPPPVAFFRIRCVVTLLLAGGFLFCIVKSGEQPPSAIPVTPVVARTIPDPVPPPVPPEEEGEEPVIVIDPGHGGTDPGTVANGQYEKTWTLSVATALAKELRDRGWPVELTRETDVFVPLSDRSTLANQKKRLAFVSLHFNAGGPEASGIETYYAWPRHPEAMARLDALLSTPQDQMLVDDRARLLAEALQLRTCQATGAKNRGVHNDPSHSVTRRTICPAVLIELGFLSNPAECRAIQTTAYREKMVQGLANGLEYWLQQATQPGYGIHFEPYTPPAASLVEEGEHRP